MELTVGGKHFGLDPSTEPDEVSHNYVLITSERSPSEPTASDSANFTVHLVLPTWLSRTALHTRQLDLDESFSARRWLSSGYRLWTIHGKSGFRLRIKPISVPYTTKQDSVIILHYVPNFIRIVQRGCAGIGEIIDYSIFFFRL